MIVDDGIQNQPVNQLGISQVVIQDHFQEPNEDYAYDSEKDPNLKNKVEEVKAVNDNVKV